MRMERAKWLRVAGLGATVTGQGMIEHNIAETGCVQLIGACGMAARVPRW